MPSARIKKVIALALLIAGIIFVSLRFYTDYADRYKNYAGTFVYARAEIMP